MVTVIDDTFSDGEDPAGGERRSRHPAAGLATVGWALICPALAFTGLAYCLYLPAAEMLAPVALTVCLVGLGLIGASRLWRRG